MGLLCEEMRGLAAELAEVKAEQARLREVLWRLDLPGIAAKAEMEAPRRFVPEAEHVTGGTILRHELWGAGTGELRIFRDDDLKSLRLEIGERVVRLPPAMLLVSAIRLIEYAAVPPSTSATLPRHD